MQRLGEGWVAEEALAIAVYAVCATRSFRDAVITAVNHEGDSDSTGAIAGNLAGTLYGGPGSHARLSIEQRPAWAHGAIDLQGISDLRIDAPQVPSEEPHRLQGARA